MGAEAVALPLAHALTELGRALAHDVLDVDVTLEQDPSELRPAGGWRRYRHGCVQTLAVRIRYRVRA